MREIGLGAGDFFWNGNASKSHKIDVIAEAIRLQYSLVDTAENYGDSELLVAEAIKRQPGKIAVATKVSPQNLSRDQIREACLRSMERLGVEQISLYQIHWPNPTISVHETIEGLIGLVERGLVKDVGFCNYTLAAMERLKVGYPELPFKYAQLEFNLYERFIETNGTLDFCRQHDVKVLAYSPLDQGQKTSHEPQRERILDGICRKYDMSRQQIMLAYLIGKGTVPLVRTLSIKHLNENALSSLPVLEQDDTQLLDDNFCDPIVEIPVSQIEISLNGEWGRAVYQTLDEALENRHGYSPSPVELASTIKVEGLLKPVRVRRSQSAKKPYELVGGRIRYWAWVIAHESKDVNISACVRK